MSIINDALKKAQESLEKKSKKDPYKILSDSAKDKKIDKPHSDLLEDNNPTKSKEPQFTMARVYSPNAL